MSLVSVFILCSFFVLFEPQPLTSFLPELNFSVAATVSFRPEPLASVLKRTVALLLSVSSCQLQVEWQWAQPVPALQQVEARLVLSAPHSSAGAIRRASMWVQILLVVGSMVADRSAYLPLLLQQGGSTWEVHPALQHLQRAGSKEATMASPLRAQLQQAPRVLLRSWPEQLELPVF
jgi:hypothetical protein